MQLDDHYSSNFIRCYSVTLIVSLLVSSVWIHLHHRLSATRFMGIYADYTSCAIPLGLARMRRRAKEEDVGDTILSGLRINL